MNQFNILHIIIYNSLWLFPWRSGEEGIYPHLTEFCETHLQKLDPKSRALRKDSPVATAATLPKDEWSQISDELMVCSML